MVVKIIVVAIVFVLFTYLFKRAAGSLSFSKLNMISVLYYYILVFNLAGASLVYIGARNHYIIQAIKSEEVIHVTYWILVYTVLMFPAVLIVMKRIYIRNLPVRKIEAYIAGRTFFAGNRMAIQGIVIVLTAICILAIGYVTGNIGYVPIFEAFKEGADPAVLRQAAGRSFRGNIYIKNIIMIYLTPFLSYYAYIMMRLTRTRFWYMFFPLLFVLSIFVVVYDLSKAPVINYMLGLYLIEVLLGGVKNNKKFYGLVALGVLIILFYYVFMLSQGAAIFSIYSGPAGRIIFSQIAGLFLHVRIFPLEHPFLHGASFTHWYQFIIPAASNRRSARIVMEIFNPEGVQQNTAGVMNTVFTGEAYANFGIAGVIAAPVIFGIIIGFIAYRIPGFKKTATSVLFYAEMSLLYISMVEGGFVDIFYSVSVIMTVAFVLLFKFMSDSGNRRYI